jgi:hypothetical protein
MIKIGTVSGGDCHSIIPDAMYNFIHMTFRLPPKPPAMMLALMHGLATALFQQELITGTESNGEDCLVAIVQETDVLDSSKSG